MENNKITQIKNYQFSFKLFGLVCQIGIGLRLMDAGFWNLFIITRPRDDEAQKNSAYSMLFIMTRS